MFETDKTFKNRPFLQTKLNIAFEIQLSDKMTTSWNRHTTSTRRRHGINLCLPDLGLIGDHDLRNRRKNDENN